MRESLYLKGNEKLFGVFKNIPAFKPIPDETLKNLLKLCKIRIYKPGEIIIYEGAYEKSMYILISGNVEILKENKTITNLRRTADIFGEMSLLEEEPRSATVRAEDETSCLVVDAEYLDNLKGEARDSFHAAIYQMFAQILAYRLRITTEKYTNANKENEKLKKELAAFKKITKSGLEMG